MDCSGKISLSSKIINLTIICIENSKAEVIIGKHTTDKFFITSGLKQGDGLLLLLVNIGLDMVIKEANIKREVFSNYDPGMILAYAGDIDTVESSTTKMKKMFIKIEKESKKVSFNINEEETKYIHVNRIAGRDGI